jgi:hypothetical protein
MRLRETDAAYELAEARSLFESALDALAESHRAEPDTAPSAGHECDQAGEWVEVIDESGDPRTAFEAPTCSVCGDAQVVVSRGEA